MLVFLNINFRVTEIPFHKNSNFVTHFVKHYAVFMKTLSFKIVLVLMTLLATVIMGCSKDDDAEHIINQDGYGSLMATKTVLFTEAFDSLIFIEFNSAHAFFVKSARVTNYVDAGNVKINSEDLTRKPNNSYTYDNVETPLIFDQITWEVEGRGNLTGFSKTVDKPLPEFNGHADLPKYINKSEGFTIILGSKVSNADSVMVTILTSSKIVSKTVAGTADSINLSPAELHELPAGNCIFQITPYNFSTATLSDIRYYFSNLSHYINRNVPVYY